tara:strand:+ start:200 stop:496 length:297 start_codon:yes stop_codon:yes gene_type:complete
MTDKIINKPKFQTCKMGGKLISGRIEWDRGVVWIGCSSGWYSLQDGELLHAQDADQVKNEPDSWVQVSDLTELRIWEYTQLRDKLMKEFDYELEGKFI